MIDIQNGNRLIPLAQVPSLPFIPRRRCGRKLHVSTVFRWAQRGVGGIRLEVVRVGGSLCTTIPDLQSFFSALANAHRPASTAVRSALTRSSLDRVERDLDAAGI
jgi:hypothetical protein